jgi:hypothetical protein
MSPTSKRDGTADPRQPFPREVRAPARLEVRPHSAGVRESALSALVGVVGAIPMLCPFSLRAQRRNCSTDPPTAHAALDLDAQEHQEIRRRRHARQRQAGLDEDEVADKVRVLDGEVERDIAAAAQADDRSGSELELSNKSGGVVTVDPPGAG